ncbi:TonB-dependent siderophore receptor [Neisseriaceae bacterium CLB008]
MNPEKKRPAVAAAHEGGPSPTVSIWAQAAMAVCCLSALSQAQAETVGDSAAIADITVEGHGQAPRQGAVRGWVAETSTVGSKAPTDILTSSQSISVVTRQQMDLQQANSTSQALRYTAGATSEKFGGFGDYIDLTKIRGADADYYLDGLRVISNPGSWLPQVDAYGLERVEVLRGPSSSVYGQGTGGGVINQISRKPSAVQSQELSLSYGRFNRKHLGLDATGPLNDAQTLLYRITASGLDSKGQVEDTRHKRLYVAPAITWQPNEHTAWTVMGSYTQEPHLPDYNSLPAAVLGLDNSQLPEINRRRNFSDRDFSASSRKQRSLSSLLQHDFADGWRFTSNMRYMTIDTDLQRSVVYGYQMQDDKLMLKGTYEDSPASVRAFSMDNHVNGEVTLGATTHALLFGVDYARGTVKNALYSDGPHLFDPYGPNYRPAVRPDFGPSRQAPWAVHQTFNRLGAYVQDQIAYRQWRLTLGGRFDRSRTDDETNSYSLVKTKTKQDDHKWSGRAGLSYLFGDSLAAYASYATSFDPLLGSDYKGSAFVPIEAKQREVGLKYHPEGSKTMLSAALFQLNQTNVKTSDAEHLGFNKQAGEVRTRGLDLQATLALTRQLNMMASYTYLDNELIKDTKFEGNSLVQTPQHSGSVWLDYRIGSGVAQGLQTGVGMRYLGSSYGDPSNRFKVPAVTLWDLALNYDLGHVRTEWAGASVALNVSNLTNKDYVASCTSAMYCFIGQDRTVSASLRYRW